MIVIGSNHQDQADDALMCRQGMQRPAKHAALANQDMLLGHVAAESSATTCGG